MKQHQKLTRFLSILLVAVIIATAIPKQASALAFGGKIVSSQFQMCRVGVGPYALPVPLQVIRVQRTGITKTLAYSYYSAILQMFGISTFVYKFPFAFLRSGPSVLGTYIPIPAVPWTSPPDCSYLTPLNLILKIGSSLY